MGENLERKSKIRYSETFFNCPIFYLWLMLLSSFSAQPLETKVIKKRKHSNPILFVILGYFAFILVGTLFLSLPFAQKESISFLDNFFIATSAICVTGLATIDIGTMYSHAGHWIILLLMQIGGLGIMTISTTLILLAGMRPGFSHQSVFLDQFSPENLSPNKVLKAVLPFTFGIEAIGLLVYFTQFSEPDLYNRFFSALFQTISSFCNVGFTLYPNSLIQYGSNSLVVITSALLVLAGSFGFLAITELPYLFSSKKKISLHTKLAMLVTGILVVLSMIFFFAVEHSNSLSSLAFGDKLLAAFSFSSISRTAGINLSDFTTLSSASLFLTILLMFIGANPGSCGGGIKTTTAAVIAILGINRLLGKEKTMVFGRTIPQETVNKAIYIFIIGVIVIIFSSLLLLLTESGSQPYAETSSSFLKILFEVSSAYATCGLSLGITSELSSLGRLLICFVMFVGRLGPLFLISAVVSSEKDNGVWYSEENIMVG